MNIFLKERKEDKKSWLGKIVKPWIQFEKPWIERKERWIDKEQTKGWMFR